MKYHNFLGASTRIIKSKLSENKRDALTLTSSAIAKIKELIIRQPDAAALRISVQQRGCNGFSYVLDYAKEKNRFDEEVEQDGIKIWIDPKAQLSIIGSEMDFVQTRLASEFVFRNPNIKGTCGCGESFNI